MTHLAIALNYLRNKGKSTGKGPSANLKEEFKNLNYQVQSADKGWVKNHPEEFKQMQDKLYTLAKMMKRGGNLTENVQQWIGEGYTKAQIDSVIENAKEYAGYDYPKGFEVRGARSVEHEGDLVDAKIESIYGSMMPNYWQSDLDEKQVKEILWGLIMNAKMECGGMAKNGMNVFNPAEVFDDRGEWKLALRTHDALMVGEGDDTKLLEGKIKYKKQGEKLFAYLGSTKIGYWDYGLNEGRVYDDKMKRGGETEDDGPPYFFYIEDGDNKAIVKIGYPKRGNGEGNLREFLIRGEEPYGFGGKNYQSYLTKSDIDNWLSKDYDYVEAIDSEDEFDNYLPEQRDPKMPDVNPAGEPFKKGGNADDILEFKIPEYAVSPLINGDYSGLEDEDEKTLNKWVDGIVAKYGNAHFMLPSNDELELGFCHTNDIDKLGNNCYKLLLRPDKEETKMETGGPAKEFRVDGYLTLTNSGGIEIEIDDTAEEVRYRYNNNGVYTEPEPTFIAYDQEGEPHFIGEGDRVFYLSEFMRAMAKGGKSSNPYLVAKYGKLSNEEVQKRVKELQAKGLGYNEAYALVSSSEDNKMADCGCQLGKGGGVGEFKVGDRVFHTSDNSTGRVKKVQDNGYIVWIKDEDGFEEVSMTRYLNKINKDSESLAKGGGVEYGKGGNIPSIEKRVKEINEMIDYANAHNLKVVDETGSWQSPMKYKPLKYSNGVLYVEYDELDLYKHNKGQGTTWKTVKDKVLKGNMEFDSPLNQIAKMYRKAMNHHKKYGWYESGGLAEAEKSDSSFKYGGNMDSKTEFILNYADELKNANAQIEALHKVIPNLPEAKYTELFEGLADTLSVYDTNVLEQIDHWIDRGYLGVDDYYNFASRNSDRWGTEKQMPLFAIDDAYRYASRKYPEVEEVEFAKGGPVKGIKFTPQEVRRIKGNAQSILTDERGLDSYRGHEDELSAWEQNDFKELSESLDDAYEREAVYMKSLVKKYGNKKGVHAAANKILEDAQLFRKGGQTPAQQKKIGKVMHEFKEGELHSGSKDGPIVTDPKQAIAIALSEANASKKETGGPAEEKKPTDGGVKKSPRKKFILYTNPNNTTNRAYIAVGDKVKDVLSGSRKYPGSYSILHQGTGTNEDLQKAKSVYSNYTFDDSITIMAKGGPANDGRIFQLTAVSKRRLKKPSKDKFINWLKDDKDFNPDEKIVDTYLLEYDGATIDELIKKKYIRYPDMKKGGPVGVGLAEKIMKELEQDNRVVLTGSLIKRGEKYVIKAQKREDGIQIKLYENEVDSKNIVEDEEFDSFDESLLDELKAWIENYKFKPQIKTYKDGGKTDINDPVLMAFRAGKDANIVTKVGGWKHKGPKKTPKDEAKLKQMRVVMKEDLKKLDEQHQALLVEASKHSPVGQIADKYKADLDAVEIKINGLKKNLDKINSQLSH